MGLEAVTRILIIRKKETKSRTLLKLTTKVRLRGKLSPQTTDIWVNTENHNSLGAEATVRSTKIVIDEFLDAECKVA